jgi:hypothetical protein
VAESGDAVYDSRTELGPGVEESFTQLESQTKLVRVDELVDGPAWLSVSK